jgi:hypothetical protein
MDFFDMCATFDEGAFLPAPTRSAASAVEYLRFLSTVQLQGVWP